MENNNKKNKLKGMLSFLTNITKREKVLSGELSTFEKKKINKLMLDCLKEAGGEVASRERAAYIGQTYLELKKEGRKEILSMLLSFKHDQNKIISGIKGLTQNIDENGEIKEDYIYELKYNLTSPRKKILKNFNFLENGVSVLVEMREDLLKIIDAGNKEFIPLEKDFERLFKSWFDVGFLQLERITWDSPASLLQKVIMYEAVHKIKSWSDLENRLSKDRRFYAFFHPRLQGVPLIFVEIALMDKVADSVQEILDETKPIENTDKADTAIFYSISNTQNGLRGISFGNFLIKRVVKELQNDFPKLKNFVTLSPIPRFVPWLKDMIKKNKIEELVKDSVVYEKKSNISIEEITKKIVDDIKSIVADPANSFKKYEDKYVKDILRPIVERLCAIYLLNEKEEWGNDAVLKFHLNNGAYIYRLNWQGDTSDNGFKQSLGLMVNYWYDLKEVEKNHEEFSMNKKIHSSNIKKMLNNKVNLV